MSGFDRLVDNIEEYINRQGYTLGVNAEPLQDLLHSIISCYFNNIITDNQYEQMYKRFMHQVYELVYEL